MARRRSTRAVRPAAGATALVASFLLTLAVGAPTADAIAIGSTRIVSVADDDTYRNEGSAWAYAPEVSADGRYVAFHSNDETLVVGDTNGQTDVFVRDVVVGTTERVSVASDGSQGDGYSVQPQISGDGRYVGFTSGSSNFAPGDGDGDGDAFLHDRQTETTILIPGESMGDVSADGNWVATLYPLTLYDRTAGTADQLRGEGARQAVLSADGGKLAFTMVGGPEPNTDLCGSCGVYGCHNCDDVFVYMRDTDQFQQVSLAADGTNEGGYHASDPLIDADGSVIYFARSSQLVSWDEATGDLTTHSGIYPELLSTSADGRYVCCDNGGNAGLMLLDLVGDTTIRLDVRGNGEPTATPGGVGGGMSADGRFVAFQTEANDLAPGDAPADGDVFLRDTTGTPLPGSAPDGLVRLSTDAGWKGDDIVNSTAKGQARKVKVPKGRLLTFVIGIQNDGATVDGYLATLCPNASGFNVTNRADGSALSLDFVSAGLAPSGIDDRLRVAIRVKAKPGTRYSCKPTVRSMNDAGLTDTVRIGIRVI